jgi:hypothetical protein
MIIKINGIQAEGSFNFVQTKQVNDISDINTRQSNIAQVRLPYTATNNKIFKMLHAIGNTSDFPYRKQLVDVIDTDTGVHMVKNGYCIMREVGNGYNLAIYDGFLEFAKLIENKTLFELGLIELNHTKNLTNVIATWNNLTLPYRYLLADYNGKNIHSSKINIDYQVPSANVKYLWDKIFDFAGYEYEGDIFTDEDFTDLWLTYPKPPPTDEPVVTNIVTSDHVLVANQPPNQPWNWSTVYQLIPNNSIVATTTGVYRIKIDGQVFILGTSTPATYFILVRDVNNVLVYNQTFSFSSNNLHNINADAGSTIYIFVNGDASNLTIDQTITTTIDLIDGYVLGFDEAFIDFKCTDFIKEILVRFGLTPFKVKHENKIIFKTLKERLTTADVIDWSNKFNSLDKTSFVYKTYAKTNDLKFRYNEENEKHSDGKITIDNENLNENYTIFQSKTYTHEFDATDVSLFNREIYKLWNREIKDNSDVEYKGLSGRFTFLKSELKNLDIDITSELLNIDDDNNKYYLANYFLCTWPQLILKYYADFAYILENAKMQTLSINLKKHEIESFDFQSLVYIKQLASYFLVNKINNYTPNKPVKVELIQIQYGNTIQVAPPVFFLTITNISESSCNITLDVLTNITQPATVMIRVFENTFDMFGAPALVERNLLNMVGTMTGNEVTFSASSLPNSSWNGFTGGYAFKLQYLAVESNLTQTIDLSCYAPTNPTFVDVVSADIILQGLEGGWYVYKIEVEIDTDVSYPQNGIVFWSYNNVDFIFNEPILFTTNTKDFKVFQLQVIGMPTPPPPTHLKIKIGSITSASAPIS